MNILTDQNNFYLKPVDLQSSVWHDTHMIFYLRKIFVVVLSQILFVSFFTKPLCAEPHLASLHETDSITFDYLTCENAQHPLHESCINCEMGARKTANLFTQKYKKFERVGLSTKRVSIAEVFSFTFKNSRKRELLISRFSKALDHLIFGSMSLLY